MSASGTLIVDPCQAQTHGNHKRCYRPAMAMGTTNPQKAGKKIRELPRRDNSEEREPTFLAESSKEFFTAEPSHLSIFTGLSSIFHCNEKCGVRAISSQHGHQERRHTRQWLPVWENLAGQRESAAKSCLSSTVPVPGWVSAYTPSLRFHLVPQRGSRFHLAPTFAASAALPRKGQLGWIPAFGCSPAFYATLLHTDSWLMEETFENPQLSWYEGRFRRHKQRISVKTILWNKSRGLCHSSHLFKSPAGMGSLPSNNGHVQRLSFSKGPTFP